MRHRRRPQRARSHPRSAHDGLAEEVRPHHRLRILVLFSGAVVGFSLIGYRLVCLQVWWSPAYREIAQEQHRSTLRIEARRGSVRDRHGRVLATTKRVRSVFATPAAVTDPVQTALTLAPYVQRSPRKVYAQITGDAGFVYLRRHLPEAVGDEIAGLQLPGIGLEDEQRRYYPNGRLAGTLLGFAGVDNQGLDGVEFRYDAVLRGEPGWRVTTRDVYGRSLPALNRLHVAPQPGADLTLTIDQVVQYHTTQVLARVLRQQRARSATAVVLDPRTGALRALVSLPDFDPNDFAAATPAQRRNRAVTDAFEPGSVFKVVPAVAVLEAGLVEPSTLVYCEEGWYRYYGHVINDVQPHGAITFADVLATSSNIGIVKVANLLSPAALDRQITLFGFGRRTGVGLPGESPGIYRSPARWSKLSMGALPIGQEIAVTAIQLAAAYGAIANDGIRMRPYVVDTVRDAAGRVLERGQLQAEARVCSPATARAMRRLLARVVAEGSGHNAAVTGYSVAGKTGTAQKTDPATGRYSSEEYVAVFAGMVPAQRPRFVMVIVVEAPRLEIWGGKVAAPAFADIATELVQYMEIPPDLPPDAEHGLPVRMVPHPAEQSAMPPETYLTAGLMPDLTGHTMRQVLALLQPYPVQVRLVGSGLVVEQTPEVGAPLRADMVCTVTCGSSSA